VGKYPTPELTRAWRHILIAALVVGLIAVCYRFIDRPALLWARDLDPLIVAVFKEITLLGSSTPYLAALTVLYPALRFSRRLLAAKRALFVIAAIVVSGLTVDLLKPVVARWRPKAFFTDPSHYGFAFFKLGKVHNSFPSGHATTAWAVACALTLLYPRQRVLWISAAALVAASRVIVGAHYPGDVVAGAWFGVVITLALSRMAWFHDALGTRGSASQNAGKSV
jgi:membrane-associated phospholipid phosphatase